jgi:hypothetical protein
MSNRRWRDYRTAAGRRPVRDFLDGLTDADAAAVVAAMKEVQADGLIAARHLRGEIYEVRADGDRQAFRIRGHLEEDAEDSTRGHPSCGTAADGLAAPSASVADRPSHG